MKNVYQHFLKKFNIFFKIPFLPPREAGAWQWGDAWVSMARDDRRASVAGLQRRDDCGPTVAGGPELSACVGDSHKGPLITGERTHLFAK
jgi:hypothetical protein